MDAASATARDDPDCCPFCDKAVTVRPAEPEGDIPCPHCGTLLWFVCRYAGERRVLTFLPGLISASESLARLGEVQSAISGAVKVVLKLDYVQILTSTFLNMLIALQRRTPSETRSLRLCGAHPDIREVLRITQVDKLFEVYDDERAALTG